MAARGPEAPPKHRDPVEHASLRFTTPDSISRISGVRVFSRLVRSATGVVLRRNSAVGRRQWVHAGLRNLGYNRAAPHVSGASKPSAIIQP